MARRSVLMQRTLWTVPIALVAIAFWVVGIGVGWRAWLMIGPDLGIVGHTDAFGRSASMWFIVAAILTLTTVVMGVGVAILRHVVDATVESSPVLETVAVVEAVPELEPIPELEPGDIVELEPDTPS